MIGSVFRTNTTELLTASWQVMALPGSFKLMADLIEFSPLGAQQQVEAVFAELQDAPYAAALALLTAASEAYNARPRRDRDASANAFDALESVAKTKHAMPRETFVGVLNNIRGIPAFNPEIMRVLEAINTLRNRNFGHGMVAPLNLTSAEVDFTYLTCIAAILLFTRTP
jgi:hypothetical protein